MTFLLLVLGCCEPPPRSPLRRGLVGRLLPYSFVVGYLWLGLAAPPWRRRRQPFRVNPPADA